MKTSVLHSESLGIKRENLLKNNLAWMLYMWKLKIDKYPLHNTKVFVQTWSSEINKFFAFREFEMRDENGNIIAQATTTWILVDILKKKPTRIESKYIQYYKPNGIKLIKDNKNLKYMKEEDFTQLDKFYPLDLDLDYNNHVNNLSYIKWILDRIDIEYLRNYKLEYLAINYFKEITKDELVNISLKGDNLQDSLRQQKLLYFYISTLNGGKSIAETIWVKYLNNSKNSVII